MKILFSPSEEKHFIYHTDFSAENAADSADFKTKSSVESKMNPSLANFNIANYVESSSNLDFLENLLFGANPRKEFVESYLHFLNRASSSDISRLLGFKDLSGVKRGLETLMACGNLDSTKIVESLYLYNGVAFKALDIGSLDKKSVDFLLQNVLIFSNLFGVVRGGDKLPFYKLKQGESFGDFSPKMLYENFKVLLDDYFDDLSCEILDLRAEFYVKLYTLNVPHTKFEFYQNGKKSTHFSKHYRGLFLRELARKIAADGEFKEECIAPFKLKDISLNRLSKVVKYEVQI